MKPQYLNLIMTSGSPAPPEPNPDRRYFKLFVEEQVGKLSPHAGYLLDCMTREVGVKAPIILYGGRTKASDVIDHMSRTLHQRGMDLLAVPRNPHPAPLMLFADDSFFLPPVRLRDLDLGGSLLGEPRFTYLDGTHFNTSANRFLEMFR